MGKNTLASTPLAHKVISMFDPLVAMLPWNKRLIYKRFKEYILNNRAAISEATELSPVEAALLVLLLAERERTDRVHNELYARIEKMEDEPDAYL